MARETGTKQLVCVEIASEAIGVEILCFRRAFGCAFGAAMLPSSN